MRATQIAIEHLAEVGLTTKEFVTLEFIANNPGVSQKDIAYEIGTTPSLMDKILDDLTERGLLIRQRSTRDRRRHHVQLTETGDGLRERIRELAFAADDVLMQEAGFSAGEKQVLLSLLRKLTNRETTD